MTRFGKTQRRIAEPPGTARKGRGTGGVRHLQKLGLNSATGVWQASGSWAATSAPQLEQGLVHTSRDPRGAVGRRKRTGAAEAISHLPGVGASWPRVRELLLVPEPEGRTKTPSAPSQALPNSFKRSSFDLRSPKPLTLWLTALPGHEGDSKQRNGPSPFLSAVIIALRSEMWLPFKK